MKRLVISLVVSLFFGMIYSQNSSAQSVNLTCCRPDTVKSVFLKIEPPTFYPIKLNHFNAPLGNKILRGVGYSIGFNLMLASFLLIAPDNITM
jgi:hypothetical protein